MPDVPLDSNEDDAELLITIPFNGAVKIKAISIIGGADGTSPSRLKAYTNRNDLDFATVADMAATQAWDLQEHQQASMEYPTQYAFVRLLCLPVFAKVFECQMSCSALQSPAYVALASKQSQHYGHMRLHLVARTLCKAA